MRFAKWVFLVAGVYGVAVVAPLFFLEKRLGEDYPPAVTHPEFYFGFAGTVLAWQLMYLLIGTDPVRYRPAMLVAIFAKASFAVAMAILFATGRVAGMMFGLAMADAVFSVLFIESWRRTPNTWPGGG